MPTYPKVGQKPKLKLDNIGGVTFVPDNKEAAGWTMTGPMDLRTAVLAVRIGRYLREYGKWGVSADWGKQPITLPNGKTGKEWPISVQPYFRLDVDTLAGEFFKAVYHFLAGEASDNGKDHESSIGDRSQILCPDTPDVGQRPYHQDHIHCEVAF